MTIRRDRETGSRSGNPETHPLADARLYLIVPPPDDVVLAASGVRATSGTEDPFARWLHRIAAAVRGGVDVVQLRFKRKATRHVVAAAAKLKPTLAASGALLIVNDDVAAAREAGADGVHLGQRDGSVRAARAELGSGALIGVSTHSLEQAVEAERQGADYLGFGAMFDTRTKDEIELVGPAALAAVVARVRVPVFAIGGIDASNVRQIVDHGGERIAVSGAILSAKDPESAARELRARLRAI